MADPIDVHQLTAEATRRARDAAYVAVGLGILGVQRLQTRRRAVMRVAERDEHLSQLRAGVLTGAGQLASWLEGPVETAATSLSPLDELLPTPAREIAGRARSSLSALGAQLRQLAAGA